MKKLVLFGDSVIAGSWHGEVSDILDQAILKALSAVNLFDFRIVNLGKPGDSTTSALERIQEAVAEEADVIVLNVGINDAINIRDNMDTYGKNLETMMMRFPQHKVIVVGPSYVDDSIKTQAKQDIIQAYSQHLEAICRNNGIEFVNIYDIEMQAKDPNVYVQEDGLHPSKEGYTLLAQSIVATMVRS